MISYLGHDPQLLSDTIYNNITLGSGKDINSVLKDVCFDTDLKSMPEGQDTLVGNGGVRLSGGQQSRIALARTLINKNKIIVLDDPFSAVDMKTEEKIIKNIKNNYKNSLIILISHRLTIFSEVNQIILLHGDKTAEYGTHNELMKSSELYRTIYNLQCTNGGDNDER
jgi:ABC-type multidrug transport system fused ATPase/permease subunit